MSRALGWLRGLRFWFRNRQALHAEVVSLRRQVTAVRHELDKVIVRHGYEASGLRADVVELRREAETAHGLWQAAAGNLAQERQWGNKLAARLRRADEIADELPGGVADRLRRETRPQMVEAADA